MHCIVTAGPTFEPLDQVRRLTNLSTGRLGSDLADYLVGQGHTVTLLLGEQAAFPGPATASDVRRFTTTADLREQFEALATPKIGAVFHAAAVSDFAFGKVWRRQAGGGMEEIVSGKFPTRDGALMVELVPTVKVIAALRSWFPAAVLVGWKYEVDGGRSSLIELAGKQIAEYRLNACVANGPAYGDGFGLITGAKECRHCGDALKLYRALSENFAARS